jgi:hypothetical protein
MEIRKNKLYNLNNILKENYVDTGHFRTINTTTQISNKLPMKI